MAISPSQRKAVAKYNAANYDRIELRLPKGRKAELEAQAQTVGETINGYVNTLIRKDLGVPAEEWGKESNMKTLGQLRRILSDHGYALRKKHRGEDSWIIVNAGLNGVVAGNENGDATPGLTTEGIADWIEYMGFSHI